MLPRMGLKKSHLQRLSSLISESDADYMYKETLKDGSDLLKRSRSIRKMASSGSYFEMKGEDSEENEEARATEIVR